jgi:hypothetical protein
MPDKPRKATGTKRMAELGYKNVQIWLAPQAWLDLQSLCWGTNTPMARYVHQVLSKHLAHARVKK